MFKVVLKRSAEKFLFRVNKKIRMKIFQVLKNLETNPIPFKVYDLVKLKGYKNRFRIRMGKVRIVYEFVPEKLTVIVWDINFRERIY